MNPILILKYYHEIVLKKGNRHLFIRQLHENINKILNGFEVKSLKHGPMVTTISLNYESDLENLKERFASLHGIEKFSIGYRVELDLDSIKAATSKLIEDIDDIEGLSFKIRTSRTDKVFHLKSSEVNEIMGDFVRENYNLKVNLTNPNIIVNIQLLRNNALVSVNDDIGIGGMPVGVGGLLAMMLSGGIDSPVAAQMMMNRGAKILFIHFHSYPLVDGTSKEKAKELTKLLSRYQFDSTLLMVPFSQIQQRLIVSTPPEYRVILYRRFMIRITELLAIRYGAKAIVTGESLGQVSSQTIENISVIDKAVKELPIIRPLIGMDKNSIVNAARRIGSYPVSIIPDQDCCSLFVPKHPVTKGKLKSVEAIEGNLSIWNMVEEAVAITESIDFRWPN
jgi:thiamine biosynthesis protein ThiI